MRTNPHNQHLQSNPTEGNQDAMMTSARDKSRYEDSAISLLYLNDSLNISVNEDGAFPKLGPTATQVPSHPIFDKSIAGNNHEIIDLRESQSNPSEPPKNINIVPTNTSSRLPLKTIEHASNRLSRRCSSESKKRKAKVFPNLEEPINMMKTASPNHSMCIEVYGDQNIESKPIDLKDLVREQALEQLDIVEIKVESNKGRENCRKNQRATEEETKETPIKVENKNEAGQLELNVVNQTIVRNRAIEFPVVLQSIERPIYVSPHGNNVRHMNAAVNEGPSSRERIESQTQRDERAEDTQPSAPAQQEVSPDLWSGQQLGVEPYLRKRIGLFVTLILTCLFLWLYIEGKLAFQVVIIPFYLYLGYLFVEGVISKRRASRMEAWQLRDHKLNTIWILSSIVSLALINLKIMNILSASVFAGIPLLVATTLYPFFSTAPDGVKFGSSALKCLYAVQTIAITLKLDQIFDFDWTYVLLVSLIYLGVVVAYCVCYQFFIIFLVVTKITQGFDGGVLGIKIQFLGLLWFFLYYGLSSVAFLAIIGGINASQGPDRNTEILKKAAIAGFFLNIVMLVFTVLAFKILARFIIVHFEVEGSRETQSENSVRESGPTIILRVEKGRRYFMNLSSTYFLPLTRDFLTKHKPNLEKAKNLFKELRLRNMLPKIANQAQNRNENENKPVNIETLHKDKEALDKKVGDALKNRQQATAFSPMHKFLKLFSPKNLHIQQQPSIESEFSSIDILKHNPKVSLSVDNIEQFEQICSAQKEKAEGNEEKLCYLCYARPPNCILMNCGHGGFCYDCASAAIKAKNECMECRAKVYTIHKIDPKLMNCNIIKSIEARRVIVRQPNPYWDESF